MAEIYTLHGEKTEDGRTYVGTEKTCPLVGLCMKEDCQWWVNDGCNVVKNAEKSETMLQITVITLQITVVTAIFIVGILLFL